jgi:hypothetical protein
MNSRTVDTDTSQEHQGLSSAGMPYAIEARFDPELERALFDVWAGLAAANVPTPANLGLRPHLSLALFGEVGEVAQAAGAELRSRLAAFAGTTPLVPVKLDALGVFVSPGQEPGEDAIVYLTPVVTEGLLAVHRRLHETVTSDRVTVTDPRYLPDRWMPHVTLTERVPNPTASIAVWHLLGRFRPPLVGHLVEVGLVRFDPTKQRPAERPYGFPLGTGPGAG